MLISIRLETVAGEKKKKQKQKQFMWYAEMYTPFDWFLPIIY